MGSFFKLLRPHQWVKNMLIFVPLITAHQLFNPHIFRIALVSAVTFCGVSSALYIFNDILDRHSDRTHPVKRFRPIAAGTISIVAAASIAGVLFCAAMTGAFLYSNSLMGFLFLYAMVSASYSLFLKRLFLVDVFVLTGLYLLRLGVGFVVTGLAYSAWLLAFAVFFFLGLALLKRAIELREVVQAGEFVSRRGYRKVDFPVVSQFGMVSSCISSLVLVLYLNSDQMIRLYKHPIILWLVCPLVLFWTIRLWALMFRGEVNEDPVRFVIRDIPSYGVSIAIGAVLLGAVGL